MSLSEDLEGNVRAGIGAILSADELRALIAELRASRKVVEAFRRDLDSLGDDFVESTEALQEYDSLVNARGTSDSEH